MDRVKRQIVRASSVDSWRDFKPFEVVLENELENLYEESRMVFVSGNPDMTHEMKAKLVGREQLIQELLAFFKDGNLDVFFNERNGVELVKDNEYKEDSQH